LFIKKKVFLNKILKSKAKKKYGKYWKKMQNLNWLTEITVSLVNGKIDIPEKNLNIAFRATKGEKINHLKWN